MATAPARQTFTKRSVPFSTLEDPQLSSNRGRSESMRSVGTEYSDAYPVDLATLDPKAEALKARYLEEKRSLEDRARRTQRAPVARVMDRREALGRHIANIVSPGKKVTIKLKRRGELGGRKAKNNTKKQVKAPSKNKQNKRTKRQPKRRD